MLGANLQSFWRGKKKQKDRLCKTNGIYKAGLLFVFVQLTLSVLFFFFLNSLLIGAEVMKFWSVRVNNLSQKSATKCEKGLFQSFTNQQKNFMNPLSGGSLGSRNDEERSKSRYVMRIAEFSDTSYLWTHYAPSGYPWGHAFLSAATTSIEICFMNFPREMIVTMTGCC